MFKTAGPKPCLPLSPSLSQPRDIVRSGNVAGPVRPGSEETVVLVLPFCPARDTTGSRRIRGPPIGCASQRREGSATFPTGYTELTRRPANSRRARNRRKEGRRRYGTPDGGFMLNGLDSGMRALDGLPSPRVLSLPAFVPLVSSPPLPRPRFLRSSDRARSSSSSRNRIASEATLLQPTKGRLRWR